LPRRQRQLFSELLVGRWGSVRCPFSWAVAAPPDTVGSARIDRRRQRGSARPLVAQALAWGCSAAAFLQCCWHTCLPLRSASGASGVVRRCWVRSQRPVQVGLARTGRDWSCRAQVLPPASSPLPTLAAGFGGGSKACPFGHFVADGGCWVVLVGHRGGLTPLVPPTVGLVEGCLLLLMMLG
jgi:hypothetical protein